MRSRRSATWCAASARRCRRPSIYVYDNNSSDLTALKARAAGAIVIREPRQGKGNVVRRMFADIEADIYLMADGDGTYAPEDAPQLINTLLTERSDMAVGTRRGVTDDAGRAGHAFGNRIFNGLYKRLFGRDFTDIFSGYRAFTRRFVKSFPAVSGGFEIETEMSVHASQLKLPVSEIALDYGRRPEGSSSKLVDLQDGAKILWMFAMLMKETQPLRFFGAFAGVVSRVEPGADDAGAGRIFRDRPGAAHADLGAVGRPAAVVGADGGDRADPRFGVARPRRAEAHLLSEHAAGKGQRVTANCRRQRPELLGAGPRRRHETPRPLHPRRRHRLPRRRGDARLLVHAALVHLSRACCRSVLRLPSPG